MTSQVPYDEIVLEGGEVIPYDRSQYSSPLANLGWLTTAGPFGGGEGVREEINDHAGRRAGATRALQTQQMLLNMLLNRAGNPPPR